MIIPLSSILAVSATTYTILHNTREQAVFHGDSRGSQTTGINFDGSITPVHAATDTPLSSIPTASTTLNVPLITKAPSPLSTASNRFGVSSATETTLAALWAFISPSPYLLRRGEESSSESSLTGGAGATSTVSDTATPQSSSSTSSFLQASSSSETGTALPNSSTQEPSSSSSQPLSTSETSDIDTSLSQATTAAASDTSGVPSETSSTVPTSSVDSPVPTLTSILTLDSSLSLPSSFSTPTSSLATATTIDSSSSTNAPEPTLSPSRSSSSVAPPSSSPSSSSSTSVSFSSTDAPESTSSPASSSSSSTSPSSSSFSSSPTTSDKELSSTSDAGTDTTRSTSSIHPSLTTVFTSSTIANNEGTSTAMETFTTTIVTSRSGSSETLTSVIVMPSGSLNDGASGNSKALPKGAIAAIAIVSVLAIGAVALWLFFAHRRRRRRDMHRNLHYSVGGGGAVRSSPDGQSGMRSLGAGFGLGAGTAYGLGRGRSNSSGMPIRTSPLHDEDADLEAPHSTSVHSGVSGGPSSLEGGLMREANTGTGLGILPDWIVDPVRTDAAGFSAERLRGGDAEREAEGVTPESLCSQEREQNLLDAAGLGSSASTSAAPLQPRSSLSFAPDPFFNPKRTPFSLTPYPPVQKERSVSPRPTSPVRMSLLPTRSEVYEAGPSLTSGPSKDSRRVTVARSSSGSAYLRRNPPPSAWPVIDIPKDKGKEKDGSPSSPSPVNEPDKGTFGRVRSRSSVELSSSGHGYGHGTLAVTSSQGHGSATASGENEFGYSSGSASTGSHHGSTASQKQKKRRSNSEDGGFFARAASLTRTNLRTRLRRVSASGVVSDGEDKAAERVARAPSPVSRLVISTPLTPAPAIGPVIPPSPASSFPPSRVPSMLVRLQSPGSISLPPVASSAMMRASGPGMGLPAILATPSPLPTPDGAPDGLLDPRLTARLQEIHRAQSSFSTIGLRDHEDYSRPIHALVNNRDSLTSASSDYSQRSDPETADGRTPTQPEMRV